MRLAGVISSTVQSGLVQRIDEVGVGFRRRFGGAYDRLGDVGTASAVEQLGYPVLQASFVSFATQGSFVQAFNEGTVRRIQCLSFGRNRDGSSYVSQATAVGQQVGPGAGSGVISSTATQQGLVQVVNVIGVVNTRELGRIQQGIGNVGQRTTVVDITSEELGAFLVYVAVQDALVQAQGSSFCVVVGQGNSFNFFTVDEGQELSVGDRSGLVAGQVDVEVVADCEGIVIARAVQLDNVVASTSVDDVSVVATAQDDGEVFP